MTLKHLSNLADYISADYVSSLERRLLAAEHRYYTRIALSVAGKSDKKRI